EDGDKTRLIAPPGGHQPARAAAPIPSSRETTAPPPPPAPVRRPPAAEVEASALARAEAARSIRAGDAHSESGHESKARAAPGSWALFVNMHGTVLAVAVFLATAIPLILWRNGALDRAAAAQAASLVDWLAADATAALQGGGAVSSAADTVVKEPGVVTAFVLAPDGRVLAPASQVTETIRTIPGLGFKPGDVQRLESGQNGDVIEVTRPVAVR